MQAIVASSNIFRLELSAFLLAEAGYDVCEVSDDVTLSNALDQSPPSLLLLDSQLGGGDNYTLALQIARCTRVPVILIAAQQVPSAAVQELYASGGSYLPWPYQSAELLACLQALNPLAARQIGGTDGGALP